MKNINYIIARNKLIPQAVKHADNMHGSIYTGKEESRDNWTDKWNRSFHLKMNQLAKEKGLL